MDTTEKVVYKIYNKVTGSFSNGIIMTEYDGKSKKKIPYVRFGKKGKEWSNEKNVKDHLLKYVSLGGSVANLEVVELRYHPTKPIDDWIDAKMLMKILQGKTK